MPYASNDDVRMFYEIVGTGPPLMLHVGYVGSVENWADAGYVAALQDRFQLILIDPRGQGRSDKPHQPEAYSRHCRIGDVVAVLDAVGGDRVHFWGYSMGAWIGFELGAAVPDCLRSLILGGSSAFAGNPRPVEGDFWIEHLRQGMETFARFWDDADPDFWFSAGERDRWLASDAEALIAARIQRLTEPDLPEAAIAGINVPALVYVGTEDNPAPVERSARLMPHAELVALDGLDHAQAMFRDDLILPYVLPFLARVEGEVAARSEL